MAAVGVLAACLFIIGNFWLVYRNVDENIKILQTENETVLFLNEDLTDDEITAIGAHLGSMENVDQYVYVSKDQAFEQYKADYADEADLYSDLEAQGVNPLLAYYTLSMKDISIYEETLYQLEQLDGIFRIRARADIIEGIEQTANAIYFVCYWIMGLMLIASLFIIVNTIKIARFMNRRQINIMKFVGATDWFVRWPFIYEGMFIGILAAALAFGVEWYAYTYVVEELAPVLSSLTILTFESVYMSLAAAFLACGIAVGVIGSGISIRKYLDT